MLNLRSCRNKIASLPVEKCSAVAPRIRRSIPASFSIITDSVPERKKAAAFISEIYRHTYGANIQVDYPVLISASDHQGNLLAATGFRPAEGHDHLFLEYYLAHPVETCLSEARSDIVEIGNLASTGAGATIYLFAALASHLHQRGFKQAVMTSTRALERMLRQGGIITRQIAVADASKLPNNQIRRWGSYYATHPKVVSCPVERSAQQLKHWLHEQYAWTNQNYRSRLHYCKQEEVR